MSAELYAHACNQLPDLLLAAAHPLFRIAPLKVLRSDYLAMNLLSI